MDFPFTSTVLSLIICWAIDANSAVSSMAATSAIIGFRYRALNVNETRPVGSALFPWVGSIALLRQCIKCFLGVVDEYLVGMRLRCRRAVRRKQCGALLHQPKRDGTAEFTELSATGKVARVVANYGT